VVPGRAAPESITGRLPRRRRTVAVALLAVSAVLVLTAPARAVTAPAGFFGVGGWSYPSDAQSASLSAAGLRLVRGALTWGQIQTTADPASRNWSDPDRLAREAARDGFDLIFDLSGCAVWACGTIDAPPTGATLAQYRAFVSAAVARYGPSSAFWAGQPHVPTVSWQVWNEVNGGVFWPDPTPAAYAVFLAQIASTIKTADPTATVVMSGLDELPSVSSGMPLTTFLTGLYAQPGFTANTAAIAVNGYAPDPAASAHVLDEARRVTLENHDSARPLWVTETSWASGGPPFAFTVSPETQNAYLIESFDTMLACRQRWNLQHVLWFALQDASSTIFGQPDGWYFHNGLLNLDGSPKPSYASFLTFLGSQPLPDTDQCALPGALTLDITDPQTRILSAPRFTDNTRSQLVRFTAAENGKPVAGMRFQCSLDETRWTTCRSPLNAANRREGDHTLLVRGIDPEGNVDPTPASATWLLDLTPPDTTITSRSRSRSTRRVLRVSFTGRDAGGIGHFQCRLDKKAWKTCRSPYATPRLKPGHHTIAVRAIDRAGNVDRSPARASFTIVRAKQTRRPSSTRRVGRSGVRPHLTTIVAFIPSAACWGNVQ
jgi:hypothetical protein